MASVSSAHRGRASSISMKPTYYHYPIPPASASPTVSSFTQSLPYRQSSQRDNNEQAANTKSRRRCSSLCERFPGDMSHRPLDLLRKETKAANRSPHLKKMHIPGADTIDSLDRSAFGQSYHHSGPYDATLLARNRSRQYAPVEALQTSNNEALKATPKEFIKAALERHIPLQGTATIPPGMPGYDGKVMKYQEGADLMREYDAEGGAYRRWANVKYHSDDLKGKGEPSYTIEKTLKKHKSEHKPRRTVSANPNSYELMPLRHPTYHQRSTSGSNPRNHESRPAWDLTANPENHVSRRRGLSTGQWVSDGLRRRFESLARGKKASNAVY
ncbi:BgTH12-00734 [Blumeria graminis f. sp. triticale]|uniref:BgTH12-00734 n=1 Tax=Blumeria graminis f. sp. triticale TaxID=1689686 RepID=A0A9W4D7H1_BLUGR|nr:BgTH12-00734 [Blumeria graminis f. sp. triticale]